MVTPTTRRRLVQAFGGGLVVALAGCTSEGDDDNGDDGHDDHDNGDNENGDGPGSEGLVYAFGPDAIGIIDPEDGELIEEITDDDLDGSEWGDPRISRNHERIFVNEGSRNQLLVVNTENQEIEEWIDVGGDPTHIYNPVEGEIWTHADDEGTFYVVDSEELSVIDEVDIADGGHGKLLSHDDLGDDAYAMNVTEAAAIGVDLDAREATDPVELEDAGGTHYKAYAPETGYAYAQQTNGGTAVIDTETNDVVDVLDFDGGMYLSPDDELLGCILDDEIRFVDATSEESEVVDSVEVDGEPAALRFHDSDDGLYAFTANIGSADVVVIDVDEMEEVDRIDAGEVDGEYRAGVAGGEYFLTPSDTDGTVTVVDMETQELVETVEVADGVDTVQYVGDSGVGYSSE
ncbi:hypothetical protein [Halostagnicola sp. A-GB9-2]|uniref:YncE family protein n=1 Tax=Halostagnicola sp. A-GB9-2 TaxID=3048066 RepID=UPI0024C031E2|nr:hypothetical protein [Halostagnicola sp. A-GB9-2]MDJ1431362.1 hypothetical protein [Halostagnicola sp. A-GB9-2]